MSEDVRMSDLGGQDAHRPRPDPNPAWGTPSPEPPAPGYGTPAPAYGVPPIPGQRQRPGRSGWTKAGAGAAGGAALAAKAGAFGKVFLLFKGLAVLVKFKAFASMLISVGFYAMFWGWPFALGFVLLLAVHEMGHVAALRAQGVKASAPMFIPFVGAYVAMKESPRSVAHEAWVALAGPVAGVVGSVTCLELAQISDSLLLRALAYTSFLLNLFNLLPMLPLDGGRVAGALHPILWLVGIGVAVAVMVWRPSPVLGFVLLLGGFEAVRRWREHRSGASRDYHLVPAATRGQIATAYVAVALACVWGMHVSYVVRPQ